MYCIVILCNNKSPHNECKHLQVSSFVCLFLEQLRPCSCDAYEDHRIHWELDTFVAVQNYKKQTRLYYDEGVT